jgi:GNAT superfamily N-acetyltransferase
MNRNSIIPIKEIDDNLISLIPESDRDYSEYKEVSSDQRNSYLRNKLNGIFSDKDNISFMLRDDCEVKAIWIITKERFDSEIFGIPIYKIDYLAILDKDKEKWKKIIQSSLEQIRKDLSKFCKGAYFLVGLNTNSSNMPHLLNTLISSGFYYIHTLITFGMSKNEFNNLALPGDSNILIRIVKNTDVRDIINLAKKSFKYSRFHLDPFLDKTKANLLLSTSARNSILKGFVDIMYVAEFEGKVIGYYSAKKKYIPELNLKVGYAVISAVDEDYRGHGIFKELNKNLLRWFYKNTDIAEMGTYIANTPVHRTWSKNGLKVIRGTHQLATMINI